MVAGELGGQRHPHVAGLAIAVEQNDGGPVPPTRTWMTAPFVAISCVRKFDGKVIVCAAAGGATVRATTNGMMGLSITVSPLRASSWSYCAAGPREASLSEAAGGGQRTDAVRPAFAPAVPS